MVVWLRAWALESHTWILVLATLGTHALTTPQFFPLCTMRMIMGPPSQSFRVQNANACHVLRQGPGVLSVARCCIKKG